MHVKKISLKVPGRGSPLHVPPSGVPMERDALSPEPMVYSFIYVCWSSQKGPLPRNAGKTYSHCPQSPTQMEGHNGVCPGSTRGSLMTQLSVPQCHAAFSTIAYTLAWVDQSLGNQRVS